MLPSKMTVSDINIDNLQEKRWRHPGADLSDFFNFGLDELKWKDYCGQMEQLCLDSMRIKIIIYESTGSEQNNDRGIPLELATATSSHDLLAENPFRRTDATKEKLLSEGMETAPELSPIPIGQAIQVDFGSGERLPSIYTRRPQTRDSEAIIEIVVDGTDAERETFKKDVAQLDIRVHKNIHGGNSRCYIRMYSSIPHETLQLRDGAVIASQLPNLQEAFELFNCGNSRPWLVTQQPISL